MQRREFIKTTVAGLGGLSVMRRVVRTRRRA